jgi:cobalt-zinc-cadmium efflux system membrane fusion protein
MTMNRLSWCGALVLLAALVGCGSPAAQPKPAEVGAHTHDHWWCEEHGVPEKECALCDPKVAAEFQRKGDWCDKHERPDSQCFICHPENKAKYAALYEAKYGKAPPEPER